MGWFAIRAGGDGVSEGCAPSAAGGGAAACAAATIAADAAQFQHFILFLTHSRSCCMTTALDGAPSTPRVAP